MILEWLAQKVLYILKLSMYIRKVPAIADTMFCEGRINTEYRHNPSKPHKSMSVYL